MKSHFSSSRVFLSFLLWIPISIGQARWWWCIKLWDHYWKWIRNFPNNKGTGDEKNVGDMALLESVKQVIRWSLNLFTPTCHLFSLIITFWLSRVSHTNVSEQKIQPRQNADNDDFSYCLVVTIKCRKCLIAHSLCGYKGLIVHSLCAHVSLIVHSYCGLFKNKKGF